MSASATGFQLKIANIQVLVCFCNVAALALQMANFTERWEHLIPLELLFARFAII